MAVEELKDFCRSIESCSTADVEKRLLSKEGGGSSARGREHEERDSILRGFQKGDPLDERLLAELVRLREDKGKRWVLNKVSEGRYSVGKKKISVEESREGGIVLKCGNNAFTSVEDFFEFYTVPA